MHALLSLDKGTEEWAAMHGEWTIERICEALGSPTLSKQFLSEINKASADELLNVFARWARAAESTRAAMERARTLAEAEDRGEGLPREMIDRTEKVLAEAERARSRGAA